MSQSVAAVGRDAVHAAIRRAADATGVDFSLLVETARRESALNPNARAGTSSATGLFQFIESTWFDMVRRHGGEHGLGAQAAALRNGADAETRRQILALRNDPELSARMAGELTRENFATLRQQLGREPSAGELYAAHVMGAGGAVRLVQAAARGAPDASELFPREAAANRGLFYANGHPRSAQGLLQRLDLEAGGHVQPPASADVTEPGRAPLSPELAHALFAMALLPLIAGGDSEHNEDARRVISAYTRGGRI
ncbi:MAG: transglycosylase SLT domain-containing protein [Hyphomonadaceae bacterium]|nr:transglycosylase SLT domain-containing protein [Hyphomonadaceae bacterium]